MPPGHFRAACGNAFPSMSLIQRLPNQFQTTLTATAIRYADVARHKVIIVWFSEGIVRWSYSNDKHKLPFVMPSKEPPAFSSATLEPHEIADEMDEYH